MIPLIDCSIRCTVYFTAQFEGESVNTAFQELASQLLNNQAILDKLFEQRDGCLGGRGSSYHGPNPYADSSSDDAGNGSPTRRRSGSSKSQKLAAIRRKLSFKKGQQFNEYTESDYAKNVNLERGVGGRRANGSSGCCRG